MRKAITGLVAGVLALTACTITGTPAKSLNQSASRGSAVAYLTDSPDKPLPLSIGEISPVWYVPGDDGRIPKADLFDVPQGVKLQPTINNDRNDVWDTELITKIITTPALRATHIQAIVDLVTKNHYTGIDIDYEELPASDRAAFTAFITELGKALHAKGAKLSLPVPPQTSSPASDDYGYAYNYAALGRAVDQLRVLTYDHSWSTSPPGPIAPNAWVKQVLTYTLTQVNPAKVRLGLPAYGYDWVGDKGADLTAVEAVALAQARHTPILRTGGKPWFSYDKDGVQHIVWFEDARSAASAVTLARRHHVGFFVWEFRGADPVLWSELSSQ